MVDNDSGRTDDVRTPDHSHHISSPCEPNGSGELKSSFFNRSIKIILLYLNRHVELCRDVLELCL